MTSVEPADLKAVQDSDDGLWCQRLEAAGG